MHTDGERDKVMHGRAKIVGGRGIDQLVMNLLDLGYWLLAGLTAPIWARKARGDWRRRFGHADPLGKPGKPRIMLHAVSVGEVNALRALVPMLTDHAEVVISVGTDTGIARARELFASDKAPAGARATVVRYPLDFSASVKRFLGAVRPDVVGLVELEVWPNFIRECGRRSIPVVVINGRLSARSFKGYRRFRVFLRGMFASLTRTAAQDDSYAARFVEMGVAPDRCVVTGSMKWDSAKIEDDAKGAAELGAAMGIDPSKPLVVAGSTGPGEEALLHAACPPGVQLLCAPRKVERFDDAAAGMPGCVRRSRKERAERGTDRFLLDTIGELRAAYALADVVVVGRSFGDLYGSDPVEPIALGKATVIGPRASDFQVIVEAFERDRGIVRTTREELAATLAELLASEERRRELARNGRACIVANQGATRRHAELLLSLVRK